MIQQATADVGDAGSMAVPRGFHAEWEHMLALVDGARDAELYFYFRSVDSVDGPRLKSSGRDLLSFTSNDYLGLASHPRMKQSAHDAIERFGTGATGAPLVNGTSALHRELETALAEFKGKEAAMLFSTGYQCNLGTISALVGPGDLVLADRLNHASILDGCKLSGADLRLFPHNNVRKLEGLLAGAAGYAKKLIVVEGIYSMDGDLADLPAICEVADKHDALVMVDEAHATGVMGPNGTGAVEHFGVCDQVDVIMGTLSKALASVGGFVAGSRALVEFLKHSSRSCLFSTALPPSVVANARTALEVIRDEPWRRVQLWKNSERFRDGLQRLGFDTAKSATPIIPVIIRDPFQVTEMARLTQDMGLFVCVMFPPAVPPNRSRLRVHVNAHHTDDQIDEALGIFESAGREAGVLG